MCQPSRALPEVVDGYLDIHPSTSPTELVDRDTPRLEDRSDSQSGTFLRRCHLATRRRGNHPAKWRRRAQRRVSCSAAVVPRRSIAEAVRKAPVLLATRREPCREISKLM